jgi:hypothetical protein
MEEHDEECGGQEDSGRRSEGENWTPRRSGSGGVVLQTRKQALIHAIAWGSVPECVECVVDLPVGGIHA